MRGKARRTVELIKASLEILDEIQPASVRAVCYRLFSAGLIPSMSKNETNRVSRQLTDAREEGLIPWDFIVDETRGVEATPTWADPEAFGRAVMRGYRRCKWDGQPTRVEVWSEKGTVRGTLKPVLDEFEVPFRVMHRYASATAVNSIVEDAALEERETIAFYAGDWDPSGLHMSEVDLPNRLHEYGGYGVRVERVALVESDLHDLPSFDATSKRADSQYRWFVTNHGARCWELDALSPNLLRDRVRTAILAQLDQPMWGRYVEAERIERESIVRTARAWKRLSMHPEQQEEEKP